MPRRRATSSIIALLKAPASRASSGSSTKPMPAWPTRSPPSSRTALYLLSPPRRATSGCRALYGSERSKPAGLVCWRRSGPSPHPPLRARLLLGKRAGVVVGNRSPECSRCRVRRRPSARSWWTRIAQHPRGSERPKPLLRKLLPKPLIRRDRWCGCFHPSLRSEGP